MPYGGMEYTGSGEIGLGSWYGAALPVLSRSGGEGHKESEGVLKL
jgi:hypothetical protein